MYEFYLLIIGILFAVGVLSLLLVFRLYCKRGADLRKKKEDDEFVDMNLSATFTNISASGKDQQQTSPKD